MYYLFLSILSCFNLVRVFNSAAMWRGIKVSYRVIESVISARYQIYRVTIITIYSQLSLGYSSVPFTALRIDQLLLEQQNVHYRARKGETYITEFTNHGKKLITEPKAVYLHLSVVRSSIIENIKKTRCKKCFLQRIHDTAIHTVPHRVNVKFARPTRCEWLPWYTQSTICANKFFNDHAIHYLIDTTNDLLYAQSISESSNRQRGSKNAQTYIINDWWWGLTCFSRFHISTGRWVGVELLQEKVSYRLLMTCTLFTYVSTISNLYADWEQVYDLSWALHRSIYILFVYFVIRQLLHEENEQMSVIFVLPY